MTTKKTDAAGDTVQVDDAVDRTAAVAEGVKLENDRQAEIRALALSFPDYDLKECVDAALSDATMSIDQVRKNFLAEIAKLSASPVTAGVTIAADAKDKFRAAASDAMLLSSGILNLYDANPDRKKRAEAARASGLAALGPQRLAMKCLRDAGHGNVESMDDHQLFDLSFGIGLSAGGHATSDFPLIMANAANKSLLDGFNTNPSTWRRWCRVANLKNFLQAKRLRLSEAPLLVTRGETAPAEEGTFEESAESIQAQNWAKAFVYSRQMFKNDDLGAFLSLGQRFGVGADMTIEYRVYQILTSNSKVGPTMSDAVALFHADHSNLNASSAGVPTQARLEAMVDAMMTQASIGEDSDKISAGGVPRIFLARPSVASTIEGFIGATYRGTGGLEQPQDTDLGAAKAIKVPLLATLATTDWYGVADQRVAPSFEVAFVDGVAAPRTQTIVGTTVDGVKIVVDLDFEAGCTGGYQGIARNAGA